MVCVCVVDHYHIRVEIHQMAQTKYTQWKFEP